MIHQMMINKPVCMKNNKYFKYCMSSKRQKIDIISGVEYDKINVNVNGAI